RRGTAPIAIRRARTARASAWSVRDGNACRKRARPWAAWTTSLEDRTARLSISARLDPSWWWDRPKGGPHPPKEQTGVRLTHVPIVVGDQDRALAFYTEVLGFEKRADYQQPGRPRWLTVGPKGQALEFILVDGESRVD